MSTNTTWKLNGRVYTHGQLIEYKRKKKEMEDKAKGKIADKLENTNKEKTTDVADIKETVDVEVTVEMVAEHPNDFTELDIHTTVAVEKGGMFDPSVLKEKTEAEKKNEEKLKQEGYDGRSSVEIEFDKLKDIGFHKLKKAGDKLRYKELKKQLGK